MKVKHCLPEGRGLLDLLAMRLHVKDGDKPCEGGFKGRDLEQVRPSQELL